MAITEYCIHLRSDLKGFLTMLKSQTASSAPSNNKSRYFRDRLEIQPTSTTFISFVNIPSNIILATIKTPELGYTP